MNKWMMLVIACSLISFSTCLPAEQQDYQETFRAANHAFREKKYEEALRLYSTIPHKGAAVYYNMGNAAYKTEHAGYALLYWRRAEKMWSMFGRHELLDNIRLVKKQLAEADKEVPAGFVPAFKEKVFSWLIAYPLIGLQLLFLILWAFLFFYMKIIGHNRQRWLTVIYFLFILLSGIMLAMRYGIESRRYGVIIVSQADMRSGPEPTLQVLRLMREGDEVRILKDVEDYYKVKIDHAIGWIAKKDLVMV